MKRVLIHKQTGLIFLLPADLKLEVGPWVLHDLNGKSSLGNRVQLEPFAISEEEARTFLQSRAEAALEETRQAYKNLAAFQGMIAEPGSPNLQGTEKLNELLFLISGIDPEEMLSNPEAVKTGFGAIQLGLQSFLDKAELSPESSKNIKSTLDIMEKELGTDGPNMPQISSSLDSLLDDPEAEEGLKKIYEDLFGKFKDDPEKMDSFYKLFDDLNAKLFKRNEVEDAKYRKKIRRSAKDSIAEALKARGIKPLSTDDD